MVALAGVCAALVCGSAVAADAMPVYRFYNNLTGVHFYTISGSERDTVLNNYPQFLYEGAVFWAYNNNEVGTSPVYRFYNTRLGTHFYTQSESEKNFVIANYPVFTYEGAVYYAPQTQDYAGSTALFRFYNTRTGAHFFTRNVDERDHVLATWPWFAFEGVAYFVMTGPNAGGGTGGNAAPKATLTASATTVTTPASVTLTATANDTDGSVAKVQFYSGATLLTEVTTAPYTYSYPIATAGTYSFSAVAVDNLGATGASNTVLVVANAPGGGGGNIAPKITLASSATTLTAPATAVLTATASDDDGTIASVKFYTGGTTLVSTLTAPPYTYTFNGMTAGITTFTAIATDNQGATTTSNPIAITVSAGGGGGAPVPKLTFSVSNTLVTAPSTVNLTATNVTSTGGAITRVSFYMNGAKLVDKTTTPYTFTASIPSTGVFQFTAEAADLGGGTHMTLPINVQGVNTPPSGPVNADVWRLLQQATFGPTYTEAQRVQSMGVSAWIDDQFNQPMSGYPDTKYNRIQLRTTADCATTGPGNVAYPADHPYATCVRDHLSLAMLQRDFFMNAVYAPDQLRQRVAWALSQIVVTSGNEPDLSFAYVMSRYQNLMFNNAFGNYETLLQQVTYSPAMGNYLDQANNDRASGTRVPNENYAREIMQLFSIGLEELNPDGSTINDATGMPVPTYDQNTIKEFAKVFTGLTWADPANPTATTATRKNGAYYALPMIPYPITATAGHETSAKTLLNGTVVPANQSVQQDQFDAVRNVFMHPNTPVYISKQLIQRLVTGNPSPAYVQRITTCS
jgi:hypothetical protein